MPTTRTKTRSICLYPSIDVKKVGGTGLPVQGQQRMPKHVRRFANAELNGDCRRWHWQASGTDANWYPAQGTSGWVTLRIAR